MDPSKAAKSNAVLDSDDEMEDMIAEFIKEDCEVPQLSDSDGEMEDLIEEFADAEKNKSNGNGTNIPVISDDEDVLEALSKEFRFDGAAKKSKSSVSKSKKPNSKSARVSSNKTAPKTKKRKKKY